LLIGLAFSSGAVDAISYLALGKVFTAFMTGNIVFLALGATGAGTMEATRVAGSIAAFAAGVFVAVKIVKSFKGPAVWSRGVSIALGVAAVAQACFLVCWVATSGRPSTGVGYTLTGLSALAMGLQSGAVLSLGVPGIFTTAATATVVDLMSDFAGWPLSARARGRFGGVLVGLLAGATVGAVLLAHARVYAPGLPLTATILVIVTALLAIKPPR
jgi:uncharacterized membrane protein YoaK (UPF0700 family)